MHLIVDGYGGDPQKLQDLEYIYQLLDTYPAHIGMTKIMPPYVFRYHGTKPQDWGISGFVLIAESHISIHTFPERGYINIDIFSCKAFPAEEAIRSMQEAFQLRHVQSHILDRGLEYPTEVERVVELVEKERHQVAGASAGGLRSE